MSDLTRFRCEHNAGRQRTLEVLREAPAFDPSPDDSDAKRLEAAAAYCTHLSLRLDGSLNELDREFARFLQHFARRL